MVQLNQPSFSLNPYLHPQAELISVRQNEKVTNSRNGSLLLEQLLGSSLDRLLGNRVNLEGALVELVRLAALDETSASQLEAAKDGLAVLKLEELGASLGLLNVLGLDVASGNLLNGLDRLSSGASNVACGTVDGDGKETRVRVDLALGVDACARVLLSSLGEQSEAGGPLDLGLAAQESTDDGNLGLVGGTGEGARAGETKDHGVAASVGNALLTTKVLGLGAGERAGGSGNLGEEFANPLGQLRVLGAVGNDGNVGLGVGLGSKLGDGVGAEVLGVGGRGGGDNGVAETTVEGQSVGRVDGKSLGAGKSLLVRQLDEREDLLVQGVGFSTSATSSVSCFIVRTGVLGLGDDLGEELDKVGQVIPQELGREDEVLARVKGQKLSAEKFGFAGDADGGALFGALKSPFASAQAHCRGPACAP